MVRTYGHLCFRDAEELSLELGGSLKSCACGLMSFLALAGAFLRTQEKHRCGLNFIAGVKGPPAGLDVKVRNHCLAGRFLSKLPAPEVSSMRGHTAAWTRRSLP